MLVTMLALVMVDDRQLLTAASAIDIAVGPPQPPAADKRQGRRAPGGGTGVRGIVLFQKVVPGDGGATWPNGAKHGAFWPTQRSHHARARLQQQR